LLSFFALSGSPWFSAQRATTSSGVLRPRSASERARSFGGEIPQALDAWFDRALAQNPSDRFANAIDMAHELRRAIESPGPDAPESAHPLSATLPVPDTGPFTHAGVSLRKQAATAPTVPAPAIPSLPVPGLEATVPLPVSPPAQTPSLPPHSPSMAPRPSMIVPPVSVILIVLAALVLGVFAVGTLVLVLTRFR